MRILMVCLGNICRSPMAQGIIEAKIRENGLDWYVDSAGTSGWHNGEKPDSRAIKTLLKYGIDISKQKSRRFCVNDFESFDYIFVMDKSNYEDVIKLVNNFDHHAKVKMLLDYSDGVHLQQGVPDPYYDNGFDHVFGILEQSIEKIVNKIKANQLITIDREQ